MTVGIEEGDFMTIPVRSKTTLWHAMRSFIINQLVLFEKKKCVFFFFLVDSAVSDRQMGHFILHLSFF